MKEKKTINQQLEDIGIDMLEDVDEVSFQDSYCPLCEEPTAIRYAAAPHRLTCRFCQITFTEH
tara:strand:- start:524 stop:712 length:189 start_codon:yes stop_codon:yes gene_type:complete